MFVRIMTCNVNGVRSAAKKGFFSWAAGLNCDVICLQETRASAAQFPPEAAMDGYVRYIKEAVKPGYSGVAIYAKEEPLRVIDHLEQQEYSEEGRFLLADFRAFQVASVYFPSGTSGDHRQAIKYKFMEHFEDVLARELRRKKPTIICGDINIAHKEIDIKNWRGNLKNTGFLPEERAWLDKVFSKCGYVDCMRLVDDRPERYTWWSQRAGARKKNVGWRIDYQWIPKKYAGCVKASSIYNDQIFSDHAPLIIDYEF